MSHYIFLGKWTDQGIRDIKDTPSRVVATKKEVEKLGGKWLGLFYTFGLYDYVVLAELPSNEEAMQLVLTLGKGGNVRPTILTAFPESEGYKIIEKI